MSKEQILEHFKDINVAYNECTRLDDLSNMIDSLMRETREKIISELWMEGTNMTGEYQGVWVRYRDIERIVDKYIKEITDGRI